MAGAEKIREWRQNAVGEPLLFVRSFGRSHLLAKGEGTASLLHGTGGQGCSPVDAFYLICKDDPDFEEGYQPEYIVTQFPEHLNPRGVLLKF